ncbi:hypothetical protein JR311_20125 (plasmid) [Bacillus velezensis]|uniref:hypothetical protein n=1 Tax=Bacillus velezensis TaxID=492670 RepID=UPI00195891E7|nr:hypothetical protein [Bacillus velezensis]QRV11334.1 hypothetical protein JR311_20125 [Bacillus velezensis]URJ76401.1 hypothetical protein MF619_004146 [Bacillus velezensis]URJ80357.1 hypothetical protein MF621_004108 [Bacillus velezensis]
MKVVKYLILSSIIPAIIGFITLLIGDFALGETFDIHNPFESLLIIYLIIIMYGIVEKLVDLIIKRARPSI